MNKHYGVYRAVVVNNDDPENRLRLKVRVPNLTGDLVIGWVWPMLSSIDGSAVPRPGQQVFVMFEGGDLDYPMWMGAAPAPTPSLVLGSGATETLVQIPTWSYAGGNARIPFTDPVTVSVEGEKVTWNTSGLGPISHVNGIGVSRIGVAGLPAGRRFAMLFDNGKSFYGESSHTDQWYWNEVPAVLGAGMQVVPWWNWSFWADAAIASFSVVQEFQVWLYEAA